MKGGCGPAQRRAEAGGVQSTLGNHGPCPESESLDKPPRFRDWLSQAGTEQATWASLS